MQCTKCRLDYPDSVFYPSETNKGKRRRHCPQCFRDARILRVYGVTPTAFNRILGQQGGGCAACGSQEQLCLDHDHSTMEIRGILCRACNTALGSLGDSVQRLLALAQYAQRPTRHGAMPRQAARLTGEGLARASQDILAGYQAGASIKQLMELHRLSYHAVRNRLLHAGATLRPKGGQWRKQATELAIPQKADHAACQATRLQA